MEEKNVLKHIFKKKIENSLIWLSFGENWINHKNL